MISHIGWNNLIGIAGLVIVVIAVAKAKGFGDNVAAIVGALIGVILAATNVGLAIHAAILRWLKIPAPSPYTYHWLAIGVVGTVAVVLLVIVLWLSKGARALIIFAFLGALLFVASTDIGKGLYHAFVGP